ncbi:MAG: hypothetical protein ACOH2M_02010 [Cypionkella sp.]|jgi:hypothetical protein
MRAALALLLVLAACGPISRTQAERECLPQAQVAEHPRGTVGLGIGSDGKTHVRGELNISSDYLQGRDPNQVYTNCVVRRSGEYPLRPYVTTPGAYR